MKDTYKIKSHHFIILILAMLKKINRNILSTKKEQVKSVKKTQKTRSKNKPEGLSNLAKNAS